MAAMRSRFAMRRRFLRFSLLLFVSLACVIISHLYVTYENRHLRDANDDLKVDLGDVVVNDPTHAYLRRLETAEELVWRYRIYLPPGQRYMLCFERGGVRNGSGMSDREGQFTLTCRVRRESDGKWRFRATTTDWGLITEISDDLAKQLADPTVSGQLRSDQEEYLPDVTIDLLQVGRISICGWDRSRRSCGNGGDPLMVADGKAPSTASRNSYLIRDMHQRTA